MDHPKTVPTGLTHNFALSKLLQVTPPFFSSLAKKIAYTEFDLDNGLHVILHQDRSTPIVAVSVMYHVGSKDDRPDRRGFAHFFEHLLFEGSANIARGDFSRHVERAGGVLNANTNGDRTYYYEVLPSNQLELGLWLESERMLHAKVDAKGVDTQRDVVKEEHAQRYLDQPYGSLLPEVLRRAYTDHPYRWATIGSMEDLAAASVADFEQFYHTYYVPNNATLVLAGDLDPAEAERLVRRYFGGIPRGNAVPRVGIVEAPLNAEVRDVVLDRIQLPAVVQAYRVPASGTSEFYAVDMLNRLMSNGNSARLAQELKDRTQQALHVGAFSMALEHPGLAIAFAVANAGVGVEALDAAIDEQYARVNADVVNEEELRKVKVQLESEYVGGGRRMAQVAENLAGAHVLLGDTAQVNAEVDRYLAVTPDDLLAAARSWFIPKNRVVLHYLPK